MRSKTPGTLLMAAALLAAGCAGETAPQEAAGPAPVADETANAPGTATGTTAGTDETPSVMLVDWPREPVPFGPRRRAGGVGPRAAYAPRGDAPGPGRCPDASGPGPT